MFFWFVQRPSAGWSSFILYLRRADNIFCICLSRFRLRVTSFNAANSTICTWTKNTLSLHLRLYLAVCRSFSFMLPTVDWEVQYSYPILSATPVERRKSVNDSIQVSLSRGLLATPIFKKEKSIKESIKKGFYAMVFWSEHGWSSMRSDRLRRSVGFFLIINSFFFIRKTLVIQLQPLQFRHLLTLPKYQKQQVFHRIKEKKREEKKARHLLSCTKLEKAFIFVATQWMASHLHSKHWPWISVQRNHKRLTWTKHRLLTWSLQLSKVFTTYFVKTWKTLSLSWAEHLHSIQLSWIITCLYEFN